MTKKNNIGCGTRIELFFNRTFPILTHSHTQFLNAGSLKNYLRFFIAKVYECFLKFDSGNLKLKQKKRGVISRLYADPTAPSKRVFTGKTGAPCRDTQHDTTSNGCLADDSRYEYPIYQFFSLPIKLGS